MFTHILLVLFALVARLVGDAYGWFPEANSDAPMLGVTIGATVLTLIDWAKRLDPNGKVDKVVELLAQTNEMLPDMLWKEGNLPTGHRVTVRTGLPSVFWRLLNQGVTPSKSTTAQIDEATGMLEAWSEVDKDLAELNGNVSSFRLSEAKAFLEAMNQEMQSTILYGNGGLAPEEFTGLAVRYSDLTAESGENIIDAGGATDHPDLTSIWLIAWGEETVFGLFPKGSQAGLKHNDYGETTVEVTAGVAGSRMRAYQERYQWKAGLCVKDWRYVVRIANLDISDLSTSTPPDLIDFMEHAEELIPNQLGRKVFYMNRTVRRHLRKQMRQDVANGGGLTYENVAGKKALMFGDTPIRIVDAILNTEEGVA
jgi:hypothetical protein